MGILKELEARVMVADPCGQHGYVAGVVLLVESEVWRRGSLRRQKAESACQRLTETQETKEDNLQ